MLDLCLLGTGGMMPLPKRWLTSLLTRYNGSSLLIDCGEGTQIALKESGMSPKPIDIICFTHFHADHIAGLPGFLLTMGNAEKTDDLLIIGPQGIEAIVKSLLVIAGELPFKIKYLELTEDFQTVTHKGYIIEAFKVDHRITCYGYSIRIARSGAFNADKAKELEIPLKYWNRLQHGNIIDEDGMYFSPDMVMGPDRKGIKVTYCTDSRPTQSIEKNAQNADIFICEGMYGEEDCLEKARKKKHMMMSEAALIARKAEVSELLFTHYSPSVFRPEEYMEKIREIFPKSFAPRDGYKRTIDFED